MKIREFLSNYFGSNYQNGADHRPVHQDKEDLPPALWRPAEGRLRVPWDQAGFAVRLCREVKKRAPQQNVFISPLGISLSLLLLHNGARGESRAEIEHCLGLKESDREDLNREIGSLIKEVKAVSNLELALASSVWLQEPADVVPQFKADAQEHFEADVYSVDFQLPTTLESMKAWVTAKTGGKIPAASLNLSPGEWISLLNIATFKGNWLDPFDPKETRPEEFTQSNGVLKRVPMMFHKGYFNFVMGSNFTGITLPYRGQRFRMLVLLPNHGTLDEFIEHLDPVDLISPQRYFSPGFIKMPRFRLECEARLEEILQGLGVASISDQGRADFSGIVRPAVGALIDGIRHCATCEVDEWGTVAVAFTDLKLVCGPTEIILNRPFLFCVQEFTTNFVLFLGAVEDPGLAA